MTKIQTHNTYTSTYACRTQRHNEDEWRSSFRKNIPLTLFERIVCERELETEQNCNILTPTLLAITAFLSRSPGLLNPASSHQLVWSPNSQSGVPRHFLPGADFLYRILSSWSGLQTNWLPVFTELHNSSTPTFLWASQIALIQPIHGQGYNILIDRMHLLFT